MRNVYPLCAYSQAGTAYGEDHVDTIFEGDALIRLRELPDQSAQTCVTSPPYFGLRDYGISGQLGLEATPDEYVHELVVIFREVRRVIRADGTLWLNLGDSYASQPSWGRGGGSTLQGRKQGNEEPARSDRAMWGLKPKDLVGIPWRVVLALQADDWYLRQDIIWSKPNPMPESVTDRCTKAHEYIFLLSK
jgi:DNA modification methylase